MMLNDVIFIWFNDVSWLHDFCATPGWVIHMHHLASINQINPSAIHQGRVPGFWLIEIFEHSESIWKYWLKDVKGVRDPGLMPSAAIIIHYCIHYTPKNGPKVGMTTSITCTWRQCFRICCKGWEKGGASEVVTLTTRTGSLRSTGVPLKAVTSRSTAAVVPEAPKAGAPAPRTSGAESAVPARAVARASSPVTPLAKAAAALNLTGRQTWRQSMIISIRCDFVSHCNCKKRTSACMACLPNKKIQTSPNMAQHGSTWLNYSNFICIYIYIFIYLFSFNMISTNTPQKHWLVECIGFMMSRVWDEWYVHQFISRGSLLHMSQDV